MQSKEEVIARLKQSIEEHRPRVESRQQPTAVWAQWDLAAGEWARFDALDWRPGIRWLLSLLFALNFAIGPLITFFVLGIDVLGLVIVIGVIALITPLAYWGSSLFGDGRRRHQTRKKPDEPRRVTLSGQGVWVAGVFFTFDNGLRTVKLTARPPMLILRSYVVLHNPDNNMTYRGPSVIRLLAPRGHEDEAARLAQRYQTEVINARKEARRQFYNPPEPR